MNKSHWNSQCLRWTVSVAGSWVTHCGLSGSNLSSDAPCGRIRCLTLYLWMAELVMLKWCEIPAGPWKKKNLRRCLLSNLTIVIGLSFQAGTNTPTVTTVMMGTPFAPQGPVSHTGPPSRRVMWSAAAWTLSITRASTLRTDTAWVTEQKCYLSCQSIHMLTKHIVMAFLARNLLNLKSYYFFVVFLCGCSSVSFFFSFQVWPSQTSQ